MGGISGCGPVLASLAQYNWLSLFSISNGSVPTASWSIISEPKEREEIYHLSGTLLFLSVSTFAE